MIYKGTRIHRDDNGVQYCCNTSFMMSEVTSIEEFLEPFFDTDKKLVVVYLKTHNPIIVESFDRMHELWTQFLKGTTFYVPNSLQ